jgi:hypothetical protein
MGTRSAPADREADQTGGLAGLAAPMIASAEPDAAVAD